MQGLRLVALESDGFSFAQLRESYMLEGQLTFDSCSQVGIEHLQQGVDAVRRQRAAVKCADGGWIRYRCGASLR